MRFAPLAVIGAPALAFAQPADPPTMGTYAPSAGNLPHTTPPSAAPPTSGRAQGQPPPPPRRSGMTVEANLGIGSIRRRAEGSEWSDVGIGFGVGVGGWLNEKSVITARISGVTYVEDNLPGVPDYRFTAIFFGPSVQHWVADHFWVGGGIGLGVVVRPGYDDSLSGLGLEARIGYTFTAGSENTFNASFELNPGIFKKENYGAATGVALLLGYQYL